MGSLMPGWDAEPPPAARSTVEEVEETLEEKGEGYFRRLEKARSLRHGEGLNHHLGSSPPSSGKLMKAAYLQHSVTEVHRQRDAARPPGALGRKSYSPTDWTSEFASLSGGKGRSLARTSVDGAGAARGGGVSAGGGGDEGAVRSSSLGAPMPAWWAQLDTSALNARPPDEVIEDPASAAQASFVPQFNVTGTNLL